MVKCVGCLCRPDPPGVFHVDIARSVKRSFLRGLATLLPALLTVIVLVVGISFMHTYVGKYVNVAMKYIVHWSTGLSMEWINEWYDRYWLGALGVLAAIIGLGVVAYFVGTFIGNRLAKFFDAWMTRMPVLRRIYPGAKQVSEFFFSEKKVEFRRVVAIEYPRRGLWSVGFVTGRGFKAVSDHTEQELLTVFIPSSPTPITGYIVAVPRREVIDLDGHRRRRPDHARRPRRTRRRRDRPRRRCRPGGRRRPLAASASERSNDPLTTVRG